MITKLRHEMILKQMKDKETCTVNELVNLTQSSAATIRRDLSELESLGKLVRIHGGATLNRNTMETDYSTRSVEHLSEKIKIAQIASSLIEPNDVIYIDAGTTTYEMAMFINQENLTVVTNNIKIVEPLIKNGHHVILLGGDVKPNTRAIVGENALNQVRQMSFDKAFIGANAYEASFGFSTPDIKEAHLKQQVIAQSYQSYILMDQSKLNQRTFMKFANDTEVSLISTKIKDPSIFDTDLHIISEVKS